MQDVFGEALYSYWKGDHDTPCIIERDDGHIDKGPPESFFSAELSSLESLVCIKAEGKVLDVGCGAGRHVLYYQKKGFDITGIDNSPLAVSVCEERGCKTAKVIDVFEAEDCLSGFDTILLLGNNIGIGGNLAGAKRLLTVLHKLINKDGQLLLTSIDVSKTGNPIHKKYHQESLKKQKPKGEIQIRLRYKDKEGDWFFWLHVSPAELELLASQTGWRIKEVHSEDDGAYSAILIPS